ncbi:putative bifunctional UDP-N-acetylmuramoylalanyl-D-glutamate--2,6-diaminopimelate ligase/UDP-N-acetylmuramoyl-tripeptide:D-alanyl-D-alanine ligase [compost metagenome]
MATGKKVLTFGYADHCFVQILEERANEILLKVDCTVMLVSCPFTSSAKALNVAASVAVAWALQIPRENILQGLSQFQGTPRRFQEFMWDQTPAIDDAFNASPESLYAGLQELRKISENKKVLLVLGSMLELDQETESAHRKVAHDVKELFSASASISLATVGLEAAFIADEWQRLGVSEDPAKVYATSEAAAELRTLRQNFDLVYFKGSKSLQLQKIFGEL